MGRGEVYKQDVFFIDNTDFNRGVEGGDVVDVPTNPFSDCCTVSKVFVSPSYPDDTLKNDFTSFIQFIPSIFTTTIYLQQLQLGEYVDIATLSSNTYGTLYSSFAAKNNIKPVGFKVDWLAVYNAFGLGSYRLRFNANASDIFTESYCLNLYFSDTVDETVRIDYTINSLIGGVYQDSQIDYVGLNWTNQIRLDKSIFGFASMPFEREEVRLNGGYERTVRKEFREKYRLECTRLPIDIFDRLVFEVLQADEITITDYNSINSSGSFVNVKVDVDGAVDPRYIFNKPMCDVTINFVDRYNNRRKLYN